ncbi:hypothetical protein ACVCAH_04230 [Micromonospora sp. LZ34]
MAFRTWSRLLLTALGVSLLAGAGQLGLAYGFGILRLTGSFTGVTVNQWPAQLVWVGWCAANAAVVGAVLTERMARRDGPLTGTGRQLAVAAAAALGATVVAPLCMQPARAAELVSVDPVWAVGICAVLGAVVGAGAALAVLVKPPVGWNMAAVAGVLWLLALLSVAPSLAATGPLPMVRLGVLEPAWLDADAAQRLAMLVLPTTALLAGAATGAAARWRGHPPLVAGATGAAGPVLVAFAYLTAGPGDVVDRYQLAPYYGALLAVAAGALGSAAAALARWPLGAHAAGTPAPGTQAIEPTDILRPLPAGPDLPTAGAPAEAGSARTEPAAEPAGADLAARTTGTDAIGTVPTAGGSTGRAAPAHWDWPAAGPTGDLPPRAGDHHPAGRDTTGAPLTAAGVADRPRGGGTTAAPAPRTASPDQPAESRATLAEPTTFPATPGAPAGSTRGAARSTSPTEPAPAAATSTVAGTTDPAAATGGDRAASDARPEPVPADDAAEQASSARKARSSRPAGTPAAGRTSRRPAASGPREESVAAEPADGAADAAEQPAPRPRRARKAKAATKRADPPAPAAAPATPATAAAGAAAEPVVPGGTPTGPTAPGSVSTGPTAPGSASAPPTEPGSISARPTAPGSASVAPTGPGGVSARRTGPGSVSAGPEAAAGSAATAGRDAPTAARTPGAAPAHAGDTAATRTPAAAAAVPPVPTTADANAAPPPPIVDATGTPATAKAPEVGERHGVTPEPARPVYKAVPEPATPTPDRPAAPRSTGPVAPAWSAPPRPAPAVRDEATGPAPVEETPEPTRRPRHRAPLPDLDRAASWEALATARRAGPVSPADGASPDGSTPDGAADDAAETPADADPGSTPAGTEQNGGRVRGRLGLFRRNRARTGEESPDEADEEPLPAQDEEYVDWVAGLGRPLADNEPEQESGRRSLRSTGRHHRD